MGLGFRSLGLRSHSLVVLPAVGESCMSRTKAKLEEIREDPKCSCLREHSLDSLKGVLNGVIYGIT